MEITFAEMYSGIGGVRLGFEKSNQESRQPVRESSRERQNLQHRRDSTNTKDWREGRSKTTDDYVDSEQSRGEGRSQNADGFSSESGRANGYRWWEHSFSCVWANDNDKYACQIYRKHYGDKELVEGNIRTIDPDTIPNFELLTAGFPCQSFSLAGKRKGFEDTRGTLFYEVARIASAKRPRLLLLENVKGLLSNNEGRTFAKILQTLDELGYDLEWQVLNSKHFGVPQNRERVFIIGHSRAEPTRQIFPVGQANSMASKKASREQEQVSTCIDSNYWKGADKHGQRTMIVADRTRSYADLGRNLESPKEITNALSGVQKDNLVLAVETAHTKANMKEGRFSKECHALDGGKSKAVMVANAVDCDGYLRSGERPRDENGKPQLLPIGVRRIRRLTPIECERLQGFPDGWTEGVSDTQRYKLLGNAVTTNVIEFLGKHLSSLFCV